MRDSESSLIELQEVEGCDLKKQNDDKELDENDQLVEIFYTVGKLERAEIRELLTYVLANT